MKTWISFRSFADEMQKLAAERAKVSLGKSKEEIFAALESGSPVKIHISSEAHAYGGGYFDQDKKEIHLSEKDYAILAHELGHAHIDENLLGRLIQHPYVRMLSTTPANIFAGFGAGLLMAKGKRWGLLLPAALSAPTVLSEILADRKGHKLLEEAGATEEQKKNYSDIGTSARSTYYSAPLLGTAIAALSGR